MDSLNRLVPQRANLRVLNAVIDQLSIPPERTLIKIQDVQNTWAASIPLALPDAVRAGGIGTGERVLLTAFGGGLFRGSTALVWAADLKVA